MQTASLPYQVVVHSSDTSPWIRMSKIGRAPTLQNECKHGRWDPTKGQQQKNNETEIINIMISLSYYAQFDWSILQAAFDCMACHASFPSCPEPLINLRDIINILLASFSISLLKLWILYYGLLGLWRRRGSFG